MTPETANVFHIYGAEITDDYSGRNMYSEKTHAATFMDEAHFLLVLARIMKTATDYDRSIVGNYLKGAKHDNMGKTGIIYY